MSPRKVTERLQPAGKQLPPILLRDHIDCDCASRCGEVQGADGFSLPVADPLQRPEPKRRDDRLGPVAVLKARATWCGPQPGVITT